jgi:oligopeptidase B
LRAENWQQVMREPNLLPARIREHLEAENRYTQAVMADTGELQALLFNELKGRIKEDDTTAPAPDGPFAYYLGYVTGAQHPRYCRKNRLLTEPETVLIDGQQEAAAASGYFKLGAMSHSPDHRRVAWSCDRQGSEYFSIRVRDLASGRDLPETIENTTGDVVWSADSQSIFYVENDENHRPCRVWRHTLGAATGDRLVYQEREPQYFVGLGRTLSGAFVVISSSDYESSEIRVLSTAIAEGEPQVIARREAKVEYEVDHHGDDFVILTNREAQDFKIAIAPTSRANPEEWRDLVPHIAGRLILSIECFKDYLVRLERQDGLPRIVVRHMASGEEHAIGFAEEAYSLGLGAALEHDTEILRFTYSSLTTPAKVFDYNMRTRQRRLVKEQEIPSGHDPSRYETRRIFAAAHDGEPVPISLLFAKGLKRDGSAPLWLYGYGSYGIAIPAAFNADWLSLADRGFVCAIAHIRGGKDRGDRWYRDGKGEKKLNTFKDFLAVAQHLCTERYTTRGRIIAHGGSAGGMLMGVVANLAPELFKALIAEVPFVDVLNTMLDDTLPLTPPEWQEWGNPIENRAIHDLIASYSPYDNVTRRDYPHILAIGGLTDPRVTYWEPAKWVARLRECKTNDTLLLLKTHMDAGHAGAPGRFDRLKDTAFIYAFALKVMGVATMGLPEPAAAASRKPVAAASPEVTPAAATVM